jgi:hypothetical protein
MFSTRMGRVLTAGGFACAVVASAHAQFCGPQFLYGPTQTSPGLSDAAFSLTPFDADGPGPRQPDLVLGGVFTSAGATPAQGVAAWTGAEFRALGAGPGTGNVSALAVYNQQLYAGGSFTADDPAASFIARWNGSAWIPVGAGLDAPVRALVVYDGELYAGGDFSFSGTAPIGNIARWNGSLWRTVGAGMGGGAGGSVRALATFNSVLVAGGEFTSVGALPASRVALWNGSSWQAPGSGVGGGVRAMAQFNGELVVAGGFSTAGGSPAARIARWNGVSWQTLGAGIGAGSVESLTVYAGRLFAAGSFAQAGGAPALNIASWDGGGWQALGGGTNGPVNALGTFNGELIFVGGFSLVDGLTSLRLGRWTSDARPWLAGTPAPVSIAAGSAALFAAVAPGGYALLAAQWQLESAPGSGVFATVSDGPIPGAAPASATIEQPGSATMPAPTRLVINAATTALSGRRVRVVVSNACGSVTGGPVLLTVTSGGGACCSGVVCTVASAPSCTGPNRVFAGPGSVCNAPGNALAPCCTADFNKDNARNPTDIFAFLGAFFSPDPLLVALTDTDGNQQRQPADLFAYLGAYFAGGCP